MSTKDSLGDDNLDDCGLGNLSVRASTLAGPAAVPCCKQTGIAANLPDLDGLYQSQNRCLPATSTCQHCSDRFRPTMVSMWPLTWHHAALTVRSHGRCCT